MFAKVTLVLSSLLYIALLPYMEISATHLFSPSWSGHARMHDAWQLGTNMTLAAFSMWLALARGKIRVAAAINLFITAPFVFAYIISSSYGGDMFYADGTELLIMGVNPAFAIMVVFTVTLSAVLYQTRTGAELAR